MRPVRILQDLWHTRGRGAKNAFAQRTKSPVVVLESDDWGSERVRSRATLKSLVRQGILPPEGQYHTDTLANQDDLEALGETLGSVRDSEGRSAVLSPFVNPANPDFHRIRADGFHAYAFEPMTQTLEARGDRREVMATWAGLISEGMFSPEYHGREHLQTEMWMEWLRKDPRVLKAFEHGVYSVDGNGLPPMARQFRATCFFETEAQIPVIGARLESGVQVFESVFGSTPTCFCPPNNVFHPELHGSLERSGIRAVMRTLRNPQPDGKGTGRVVVSFRPTKGTSLMSWSRNALFEPESGYGVNHCLRQMASAFSWGVPAIVSTHRVNYVGAIDPTVRERGNRELRRLLTEVARRWPAVRFMSSRDLHAAFEPGV